MSAIRNEVWELLQGPEQLSQESLERVAHLQIAVLEELETRLQEAESTIAHLTKLLKMMAHFIPSTCPHESRKGSLVGMLPND